LIFPATQALARESFRARSRESRPGEEHDALRDFPFIIIARALPLFDRVANIGVVAAGETKKEKLAALADADRERRVVIVMRGAKGPMAAVRLRLHAV